MSWSISVSMVGEQCSLAISFEDVIITAILNYFHKLEQLPKPKCYIFVTPSHPSIFCKNFLTEAVKPRSTDLNCLHISCKLAWVDRVKHMLWKCDHPRHIKKSPKKQSKIIILRKHSIEKSVQNVIKWCTLNNFGLLTFFININLSYLEGDGGSFVGLPPRYFLNF